MPRGESKAWPGLTVLDQEYWNAVADKVRFDLDERFKDGAIHIRTGHMETACGASHWAVYVHPQELSEATCLACLRAYPVQLQEKINGLALDVEHWRTVSGVTSFADTKEARGARRDVFIRCLEDFEKAVLEEDAACTIAGVTKDLMRGEKMHRRYRKAEVMLINLREQLVKMACGEG